MKKSGVIFFLFVAISIPVLTVIVIQLGKGYSFNLSEKKFEPRGILVATSIPDGAQVFVDDQLETATNNTISLPPGKYKVEIRKEGYSLWKKEVEIEKELVTKTDALLFLGVTDLRPLTFSGATNPSFSPDKLKIAYSNPATASGKGGIWLNEIFELPLGIGNREPRQIIQSQPKGRDFSKANFDWSPDSRLLLLSFEKESFLIDTSILTSEEKLKNLSLVAIENLKGNWQDEEKKSQEAKIKRLPKPLQQILTNFAADLQFSQDGEKVLYEATGSAKIPEGLIPPLPAASSQKEERGISPGRFYVYDLKEDKNFLITISPEEKKDSPKVPPLINWFPTSRHLLLTEAGKISIIEYDGTNKTAIYSGPFENFFVATYPNGSKIVILTTFGQEENQPPNLYTINLK